MHVLGKPVSRMPLEELCVASFAPLRTSLSLGALVGVQRKPIGNPLWGVPNFETDSP